MTPYSGMLVEDVSLIPQFFDQFGGSCTLWTALGISKKLGNFRENDVTKLK